MADTSTGKFKEDVLSERILSCILEFKIDEKHLLTVIDTFKKVGKEIDTVFSVGCISRCKPDGSIPVKPVLDKAGIFYQPNAKINIGLGRPLSPY
jgi:hypothetical protein